MVLEYTVSGFAYPGYPGTVPGCPYSSWHARTSLPRRQIRSTAQNTGGCIEPTRTPTVGSYAVFRGYTYRGTGYPGTVKSSDLKWFLLPSNKSNFWSKRPVPPEVLNQNSTTPTPRTHPT
eukprot:90886-Rhodomonas_salina.1